MWHKQKMWYMYISSDLLGLQDAVCHVIGTVMHCLMFLSQTHTLHYNSAVSHDSHTWHESDWYQF